MIFSVSAVPTAKPPIVENMVYERDEAIALTGFSLSTLLGARKAVELKGRSLGRRQYYLSSDLLAWLQGDGKRKK